MLALVQSQIALVVPFAVATDAGRLQNRLDVLDEIDPAHLFYHQTLRPLGPGGDPFLDCVGLVVREQFALGRHDVVVVRRQDGGGVERTFLRIAGHDDLAVLAALQQILKSVEAQFALVFFLSVTAQASRREHRLDVFLKRHLGLGQAPQPSHRGSG